MRNGLRLHFKQLVLCVGISLSLCTFAAHAESAKSVPQYQNYPIIEIYQSKNAALDMTNPTVQHFQGKLARVANKKPNFAGHYIITSWGCGAMCTTMALIDVATGKVYTPTPGKDDADWQNHLIGWHYEMPQVNSNLLIIQGQLTTLPRSERGSLKGPYRYATLYYLWENNALKLIDKTISDKPPVDKHTR